MTPRTTRAAGSGGFTAAAPPLPALSHGTALQRTQCFCPISSLAAAHHSGPRVPGVLPTQHRVLPQLCQALEQQACGCEVPAGLVLQAGAQCIRLVPGPHMCQRWPSVQAIETPHTVAQMKHATLSLLALLPCCGRIAVFRCNQAWKRPLTTSRMIARVPAGFPALMIERYESRRS